MHLLTANNVLSAQSQSFDSIRLTANDLRDDLYAALNEDGRPQVTPKAAKAASDIKELEEKVVHYDKALRLMANDALQSTVLVKALAAAAYNSEDPEEAVITAIRTEASNDLDGAYARLIPSVTGTRDGEVQAAATRMTTKLRADLDARKKIIRFWKRLAQDSDAKNHDVITPSSSRISSIQEELTKERQNIAATLRACLRAERSAAIRPSGVPAPELLADDDDDDDTETVKSFTSTSTVRPATASKPSAANSDSRELDTVEEANEMMSTTPKQTTLQQHKKRNRDKWAYRARPVLESLDVNVQPEVKNTEPFRESVHNSVVAVAKPKERGTLDQTIQVSC